jgi:hypothetical protein
VRYAEKVALRLKQLNLDLMVVADLAVESHLTGTKDEHWKRYSTAQDESSSSSWIA